MKQGWRWFGPDAAVRIDEVVQSGASDVVNALHHLSPGVVRTPEEIAARQMQLANGAEP